jgi:hypothetical protein
VANLAPVRCVVLTALFDFAGLFAIALHPASSLSVPRLNGGGCIRRQLQRELVPKRAEQDDIEPKPLFQIGHDLNLPDPAAPDEPRILIYKCEPSFFKSPAA